ncbi:MAG TPA: thiamine phosphate synthase [Cyclobacteriaceae bacterium]|jgi:thiamine-phosphate pyrophosphorylase|nr:thiamine phosphate synthase [Cyclobacteriaceae bacterium]
MSLKKILGGVYLVIDPSTDQAQLFSKLQQVLEQKISAVQIWDHWINPSDKDVIIKKIIDLCHLHLIPVLINNDWALLNELNLDGVHFDEIPNNVEEIKKKIGREFISGITCNNDLSVVEWATQHKLDYVSFCSVFPSSTSNSCDLVSFETIRRAREITSLPIFLAGGISPDNMEKLRELDFDGVAVISGIMNQDDPAQATKKYLTELNY